jgi:hypothetical protein
MRFADTRASLCIFCTCVYSWRRAQHGQQNVISISHPLTLAIGPRVFCKRRSRRVCWCIMHDIGMQIHGIPHTIQPQAAVITLGIKSKRQYEIATVDSLCPLQSHISARSALRNSTDLLILAKSKQGRIQAQHSSDGIDTPQQPHSPVSHSTAGVSTLYILETLCGRKISSSCMLTLCVLCLLDSI